MRRLICVPITLAVAWSLAACGSNATGPANTAVAATTNAPPCPTAPIPVVVSVDQWGDIVSELGGACTAVKTVLASSSIDPHDYEPSPADAASFTGAKLVVVNGADYDHWATQLASTSAPSVPVVSAAEVTKTAEGANPHLWYSPSSVVQVADAVTAEFTKVDPAAAKYFADRRADFSGALKPYTNMIAKIKATSSGKTYAATEGVFDYQATALGLVDRTPQGFKQAAANEADPSPADIEAFREALSSRKIDVLIYNTQTEGSIPEQIRTAAEQAGVPVVDVTETVPPDQTSFVGWQEKQLTSLGEALGVGL
jgi:zinc/manganese transport system substrate-binding protein